MESLERVKESLPIMNRYRVVVEGVGVVYLGGDISEAGQAFSLFARRPKTEPDEPEGDAVRLFKNYKMVKEWHRPRNIKT